MEALGMPWFAWVAIVAIVIGGLTATFGSGGRKGSDSDLSKELEQTRESARHLEARLESLEQRVVTLERGQPGPQVSDER